MSDKVIKTLISNFTNKFNLVPNVLRITKEDYAQLTESYNFTIEFVENDEQYRGPKVSYKTKDKGDDL